MHTVVETSAYLSAAKAEGMSTGEMTLVVDTIGADPKAGVVIKGSGGCRKVRIAGKGRGKSGGYRVVSFFGGQDIPVFLLAVLSKGSAENFSDAQVKAMAPVSKVLAAGARAWATPKALKDTRNDG